MLKIFSSVYNTYNARYKPYFNLDKSGFMK